MSDVLRLLPRDDPRHGQNRGYGSGCRCHACTAAHREYQRDYDRKRRPARPKVVNSRPRITLRCNDCPYTCTYATDMHQHCRVEHGRRLTDEERTPRGVGA